MGERVVQLPLPRYDLGEGPYWIEDEQALLVADVFTKSLVKHYVETGRNRILHIGTLDNCVWYFYRSMSLSIFS